MMFQKLLSHFKQAGNVVFDFMKKYFRYCSTSLPYGHTVMFISPIRPDVESGVEQC